MKMIHIAGVNYKIRYTYRREDGTMWYVLNVDGGFDGVYGDEVKVK